MDFLDRKLDYTYYSSSEKEWYVNTFTPQDDGTIRFRSVAARNPRQITGKEYRERVFKLSDLNPYHIVIEKVKEDHGMLVRGAVIELETVKHKKSIVKNMNGRRATPQSVLLIAIPSFMEDSSSSISQEIADSFQRLIFEATNLKNQFDRDKNEDAIFETLIGEHVSGEIKRFTKRHSQHVLSFEEYVNREKIRDGFIGHDPTKDQYYEILIEENGEMTTHFYNVDLESEELVLKGLGDRESINIELVNKSLFQYNENGTISEYRPSRSF